MALGSIGVTPTFLGSDGFVVVDACCIVIVTAHLREQPELRGAQATAGSEEWLAAVAAASDPNALPHETCLKR